MEDEIKRIQKEYNVDEDVLERAQDLIDEGMEEDIAIEIAEEL